MADLKTYRPSHVTAVGSPGQHARVLFREGLYIELDQFAQENGDREYGAVLLGIRRRPEGSQFDEILVNGFIPFPQRYHLHRFRLTKAEMDEVRARKATFYPELDIVGWVHTHPGFGVFLSQSDRQQHQEFFPQPWQIAFVIDPQNMTRGLYQLIEDELRELPGYYLADLPPAKAVLKRKTEQRRRRKRRVNYKRAAAAGIVILLLFGGVSVGGYLLWEQWERSNATVETPEPEEADIALREPPPAAEELARPVVEDEHAEEPLPVEEPPEEEAEPVSETEPEPETDAETSEEDVEEETAPREYVVEAGDTLWDIASAQLGDGSRFREIVELNGLDPASPLRVGMVLQLPDED